MDKFSAREKEVFGALEALENAGCSFAVIGGYAVNAYALPRFSVDCDIVVQKGVLQKVEKALESAGFARVSLPKHEAYSNFLRFEKEALNSFDATFDILVGGVHDRLSGATFPASWIFSNSSMAILPAKTFAGNRKVRIIDADALFVMKFCCARSTDIRDVLMLCDKVKDWEWVKTELASRVDLEKQHKRIMQKVSGPEYLKDLGGVFGYVEPSAFQKRLKILAGLLGH